MSALLFLLCLTAAPVWAEPYDRATYKHWTDADRDGENTREEVLIRDALPSGGWLDPYTGQIESDRRALDIDHMVPLYEAHVSGGVHWGRAAREAYANALDDPDHLIATHRRWNRQKGSRDPATWVPKRCAEGDAATCCWYGAAWTRVKLTWGLTMDPAERTALVRLLAQCPRPGEAP